MDEYEFPDLILLNDHGGHFATYNEAVYQIFRNDFVTTKPTFEGKKLALKAYPLVDGKEATYYHFTHEGADEQNRRPDIRRMERIPFPRPIIDNSTLKCFKVWVNYRGSKKRILLFCEAENYLVVLEDRKDYILPWTAYIVAEPHRRKKLLQEYQAYKMAEAAQ